MLHAALAAVVLPGLLLLSAAAGAGAWDITLAWDPNTDPGLDGYTVYYSRQAPGPPWNYAGDVPLSELDDPLRPAVTLAGLEHGVSYYFSLTAYDDSGNESDYSSPLCVLADPGVRLCAAAGDSAGLNGGASSPGSCFVQVAARRPPVLVLPARRFP